MEKEIEIRFKISDKKEKEILALLKEKNISKQKQHDYYFRHKNQKENSNYILRIRDNVLTYKAFCEDSWIEKEIKVDNSKKAIEIIKLLGNILFLEIKKERKTTNFLIEGRNIEVNVDKIESLGSFVELEIKGEDVKKDKRFLKTFAKTKWDINEDKIIEEGYVQLKLKFKKH